MEKKLYRNETNKMLGGVCSGLADYLDIDVTIVRVVFILMALFGLSGVLIYIIMWIVVPRQRISNYGADYRVKPEPVMPLPVNGKRRTGNGRLIAGIVLVFLGVYFLADEFAFIPFWFNIGKLWPLVFIIPGILILSRSREEHREETFKKDDPDSGNTTAPDSSANTDSVNPAEDKI